MTIILRWLIRDDCEQNGRSYVRSWMVDDYGEVIATWTKKQAEAQRFHTRDVATLVRARAGGAVVKLYKRNRHLVGNLTSYLDTAKANYAAGEFTGRRIEREAVIEYLRDFCTDHPCDAPCDLARYIEARKHVRALPSESKAQ